MSNTVRCHRHRHRHKRTRYKRKFHIGLFFYSFPPPPPFGWLFTVPDVHTSNDGIFLLKLSRELTNTMKNIEKE